MANSASDDRASEQKGAVVLVSRLRAALERLNPALPPEASTAQNLRRTRDLLLPRLLSGRVGWRRKSSFTRIAVFTIR